MIAKHFVVVNALLFGLVCWNSALAESARAGTPQATDLTDAEKKQLKLLLKKQSAYEASAKSKTLPKAASTAAAPVVPTPSPTPVAATDPLAFSNCPGPGPIFVLRQNLKDVGGVFNQSPDAAGGLLSSGGCPSPFAKATGATLSLSSDRVAKNRSTTFQGLAGMLLNMPGTYVGIPETYHIPGSSIGAYISNNTLYNSNISKASTNTDVTTYGGLALLTVAPPGDEGIFHNFRFSTGGVHNSIKDTENYNATFTYENSYFNHPFPIDETAPAHFFFDPTIMAQYDQSSGLKNLLGFNNRNDSFRLGADFMLSVVPNKDSALFSNTSSQFQELLGNLKASAEFHPWYEAYTGTWNYYLQSTISYNLDKAGHFALTGSYRRGLDEDLGTRLNVYVIGLTGKI